MDRSRLCFFANIAFNSIGAYAAAVPTANIDTPQTIACLTPANDLFESAWDQRCAMRHRGEEIGMNTRVRVKQAHDPREERYPAADRWIQERA